MEVTPLQELRAAQSAATARYRAKNPEKTKAMQASWRARNPDYHKHHAIGYADRKRMLARARKYTHAATRPQPANCENCGETFYHDIPARRVCYDHDHVTGKFRGWICNSCNITLARAGDCLEGVLRFVKYLKRE
jgi:hypothetical protein